MLGGSDVDFVKDELDILSEILYNYKFISKGLFSFSLDRQVCYNAFKGFLDVIRLNHAAQRDISRLETRYEIITRVSRGEDTHIKSSLMELLRWRAVNFSLSDPNECKKHIQGAHYLAFDILNRLSEFIVSEVSQLDGTMRLFEVMDLKDSVKENRLHPVFIEPRWRDVSEDVLDTCYAEVTGVWLSYFCFFIITRNAIGRGLQKVIEAASSIFRKHNLTSPDHYKFPLIITENSFKALLWSCYTDNPYIYYDCLRDDGHLKVSSTLNGFKEPPHQLVFAMAREALSIQAIAIRRSITATHNRARLYRSVLRILRLKLFFTLKQVVLPYEEVPDYYKSCYPEDAGWIAALRHYSEQGEDAVRLTDVGSVAEYYTRMRSLLDSMSWVFDSAPTPEGAGLLKPR
jgi:hypothetical protein